MGGRNMGLFTPKPYKMNSLSVAEKAAAATALEVAIQCAGNSSLAGSLKTAQRHFNRGALTQADLVVVIACLEATLEAMTEGDNSDLRTTLLKQKQWFR